MGDIKIGEFVIQEKKLRDIKLGSTICLIAPKRSGKTSLIKWFLYYNHKKIRLPVVISSTANTTLDFNKIVPDIMIHDEYKKKVFKGFMADQATVADRVKSGYYSYPIKKDGVLILDDILGTNPEWKKDRDFQKLFFQGRHFNATGLISVQKPLSIPTDYRDNIDYLIICYVGSKKNKKDLYEKFWNDRLGDQKLFEGILKECFSEKYRFLVLDFVGSKESNASLSDTVFWMKLPDPKLLLQKKFKVGHKMLWNINEKYYNPKWVIDEAIGGSKNIRKQMSDVNSNYKIKMI